MVEVAGVLYLEPHIFYIKSYEENIFNNYLNLTLIAEI